MSHRPTVYDVAKRAGVSIATVSFAFRQPERVRESTRDTVLAAARELGYVPSASARGLAKGSTGALGMYSFDLMLASPPSTDLEQDLTLDTQVDPRLYPLYVDEVERGFALSCLAGGRALLLASGAPGGAAVYDIAGRVDGLAVFPGPRSTDALATVAQRIPVVMFSNPIEDSVVSHVGVDNQAGVDLLVEHLVTVHGATKMAFLGDLSMAEFEARLEGFRASLARYTPTSTGRPDDYDGLTSPYWQDALIDLITAEHLPEAIVCQNDQVALEALDILNEHGVDVPGRVRVTGFDGILAGSLASPPLATVRQPLEAMGRTAYRLLTQRIDNPNAAPEHVVFPVTPLFRGTCGCTGHNVPPRRGRRSTHGLTGKPRATPSSRS